MMAEGELAQPTLCADVGASNVRAGLARGARVTHLVERRTSDLQAAYGGDMVLALAEVLAAVQASAAHDAEPASGQLAGPIGIGVPAIVSEGGSLRVGLSSGLPAGTALRDRLSDRFATRVVVDNDASLAALGELFYGAGTGESSLALLTLGTNIGMTAASTGVRVARPERSALSRYGSVRQLAGTWSRRDGEAPANPLLRMGTPGWKRFTVGKHWPMRGV